MPALVYFYDRYSQFSFNGGWVSHWRRERGRVWEFRLAYLWREIATVVTLNWGKAGSKAEEGIREVAKIEPFSLQGFAFLHPVFWRFPCFLSFSVLGQPSYFISQLFKKKKKAFVGRCKIVWWFVLFSYVLFYSWSLLLGEELGIGDVEDWYWNSFENLWVRFLTRLKSPLRRVWRNLPSLVTRAGLPIFFFSSFLFYICFCITGVSGADSIFMFFPPWISASEYF